MFRQTLALQALVTVLVCSFTACQENTSKSSLTETPTPPGRVALGKPSTADIAAAGQEGRLADLPSLELAEKQRSAYFAVIDAAVVDFVRAYDHAPSSLEELQDASFVFFELPTSSDHELAGELEANWVERTAPALREAAGVRGKWFTADEREQSIAYHRNLSETDPAPMLPNRGYFFRSKDPTDRRLDSWSMQLRALFIRWFALHAEPPASLEVLLAEFDLKIAGDGWLLESSPAKAVPPFAVARWNPKKGTLRFEMCPLGLSEPLVSEILFNRAPGRASTKTQSLERDDLLATYPLFAMVTVKLTEQPSLSASDLAGEEVPHGAQDRLGGVGS